MRTPIVGALATLAAALAVAVGAGPASADSATPLATSFATSLRTPFAGTVPAIHHVFIIVLENESEATTFGPGSPAPYLAKTLTADGAFLPNYFGIGHNSLDNYIAMIGGQPPTPSTSGDCPSFNDFAGGSMLNGNGVETGDGCVYPANVPTIASQLTTAGLTWKGYMDSMGADPARESATCGHPPLNTPDNTEGKETAPILDTYATRHDPFMYYHSVIDDQASCDAHVVNLSALPTDLQSVATTPNYSFITPGLCNDGHDVAGCSGGGGLTQADSFLQTWVPMITGSPAFQQDGLLIVTFDESGGGSPGLCCGEIPGPTGAAATGGGQTGTVLLSPFIAPGTVSQTAYNHYSMLGSIEDIFGLSHLAYANLPGETDFGSDVYTQPNGPPVSPPTPPPPTPPAPPAPPPTTPARLKAARAAVVHARHALVKARRHLRAAQHGHSTRRLLNALSRLDAAEARLARANAKVLTAKVSS